MGIEEVFYDGTTGFVIWKKSGRRAGWIEKNGYRRIEIKGVKYSEHRLVWALVNGVEPKELDHINGNRVDNRIENLREVTRRENNQNLAAHRAGNLPGVRFKDGDWRARIQLGQIEKHLGTFKTKEEASAAYMKAARMAS